MGDTEQSIRVLYSFPHRLGAGRICYTAWEQVNGLAAAGAHVCAFPASIARTCLPGVHVRPTLSCGKVRAPVHLLGRLRFLALHDYIVARRLERMAKDVDIVHTWPLAAFQTLRAARKLGIPTVLERPNAHTQTYYEIVNRECDLLGLRLPTNHEHAFNQAVIDKEEQEYQLSSYLLCPSEFVFKTFVNHGIDRHRLLRHQYGYDEAVYFADQRSGSEHRGLTAMFVGTCSPAKGLHYALRAWLQSPIHHRGTLLIVGDFVPCFAAKLAGLLAHSSIKVLGHRKDVPRLMREADILVLPSLGEGFGLVCAEAMGSGTVPLVSDACTDICKHMENALVHHVGDIGALERHFTLLDQDRGLLARLREGCLATAPKITWNVAGLQLLHAYHQAITSSRNDI